MVLVTVHKEQCTRLCVLIFQRFMFIVSSLFFCSHFYWPAHGAGTGAGTDYTTFTRSVIGKAGATINTIKEASGARVKVSSNQEFFPGTNERIILVRSSLELPQYAHQL